MRRRRGGLCLKVFNCFSCPYLFMVLQGMSRRHGDEGAGTKRQGEAGKCVMKDTELEKL